MVELRGFEPLTPSMRTPCGLYQQSRNAVESLCNKGFRATSCHPIPAPAGQFG
jgi:hypothetical protein